MDGSVLVTGASRGLGAHIARRLAADGRPVAVNYLPDRADAERVVRSPDMRSRGGGQIIQIGSAVFERAAPGMSAYSAAKAARLSLTRSWARELGPWGITVNVVAPGWIPVERHADIDPRSSTPTRGRSRSAGWARRPRSPTWSRSWPRRRPASSPASASR